MEDSATSLPNHNSDPSPQIQQNVEGDGNQVIGQVTGGNVFGNITSNVTIYDRVPVSSMPPPISMLPTLTQQEYRQRQVLLDKVQKFWVKGVLENSLHTRALIELGLQERLDLVKQPFSGVGEFLNAPGQVLPDGTQATAVFDEMGEGRTLLILGEPGAGKTIALLKLAEDLIVRTAPDLRQQIPVVFNLSSWARKPQTIEKWLVQELLEKYQVSKALGETWVKSEALILLLDGLDEVQSNQRNACVQALNLFMQNHGTTEVIVCCRIRDYQVLNDRLTLRSAICIQPLTFQQVNSYFDLAGEQLSALKAVLPQDKVLQELATSPLMLSVMSLAYQDFTPEQLTMIGKAKDYQKHLFETYVDRMFDRRGKTQKYQKEETQRWLIWLAQQMMAKAQTIFLIERLQSDWFPIKRQQIIYRLQVNFVILLVGMLIGALDNNNSFLANVSRIDVLGCKINWLSIIPLLMIAQAKIYLAEIKLSQKQVVSNAVVMIIMTIPAVYKSIPDSNKLIKMIVLTFPMLLYLYLLPKWFSFTSSESFSKVFIVYDVDSHKGEKPNQGILKTAQASTTIWIVGIYFYVFYRDNSSLSAILFFGLLFGGVSCIKHFILRLTLHRKRYSPWNYTHFLDYATDRLFLQKVGGGYIFVHRMLLEHFAEMSPEQEDR
jgi:hypothetical protein